MRYDFTESLPPGAMAMIALPNFIAADAAHVEAHVVEVFTSQGGSGTTYTPSANVHASVAVNNGAVMGILRNTSPSLTVNVAGHFLLPT